MVSLIGCPDTPVSVGGSSDDELGGSDSTTDTGVEEHPVDDHRTFLIGESRKFDGGGSCNNDDLNTATSSLRNALVDAGWQGRRLVDENTWPEDFREGSLSMAWLDGVYGDSARLSVYAGHGNPNTLQWGRPSPNGACNTTVKSMLRLGRFEGDTTAIVMLMASCSLQIDQIWDTYRENAFRQIFGYHNSPYIGYGEARKVFERTQDGQPTVYAWLDEMEQNGDVGKNSPVAMTFGHEPGESVQLHPNTNLASGDGFIINTAESAENFYFEWLDNGCSCAPCDSGSLEVPDILVGTTVPTLHVVRPVLDANTLVEHVQQLASVLGITLTSDELVRLETWAMASVDAGDIAYAVFGDLEVTHDPEAAQLRVRDRAAFDEARPSADGPDLDADEQALVQAAQQRADSARTAVSALPDLLGPLATEQGLSVRRVGFGGVDSETRHVAYEFVFRWRGDVAGQVLFGSQLEIGVTRLGALSTIAVSSMRAEVVGDDRTKLAPQQALELALADLALRHPGALSIDVADLHVGYVMREDQSDEVLDSSLVLGYTVAYASGETQPFMSRKHYIKRSLVVLDAAHETLEPSDPDANQGGDARD